MTKIHYDQCNIYYGKICKNRPRVDDSVIITLVDNIQLRIHYCDFHRYEANKLENIIWTKNMEQEIHG